MTLLNAQAFVVLSSEMAADQSSARGNEADPRLARAFLGRVLHPRASYSKDRRIMLCHVTDKSRFTLTCATDNALETSCPHSYKVVSFLRDFGAEMLVETARLWLDLGFYSAAKGGKFCINGVTGPDEYNAVVNNNCTAAALSHR